ncbi:MAG TPA: hypothetical protein VNX26_02360 [Candidatus Acidoferrum sp.]|jgi:hypothetical protein|nr:hypothetical protein [Candidatus Acidoferrum sp.]
MKIEERPNFLEHAKRKYPFARIGGSGRWGLLVERRGTEVSRVVLFETEQEAMDSRPFYNASVIQDVTPTPVPNIRETDEDRYEERLREKRAKNVENSRCARAGDVYGATA